MVSAELIKINIMTKEEMKAKVRSVTLCMLAHPDNEPDSEFADRISDLTEIFEALTIPSVDSRRELLIATLHGWKDYNDQGISIEDYVDEIESNL